MLDIELTDSQKNLIAWKETIYDVLMPIIKIIFLALMIYGIYLLGSYLMSKDLLQYIITGIAVLSVLVYLGFVLFRKKEEKLRKLFGYSDQWQYFTGIIPRDTVVNLQYKNGKKVWNIRDDKINWSQAIDNPVSQFSVVKHHLT